MKYLRVWGGAHPEGSELGEKDSIVEGEDE